MAAISKLYLSTFNFWNSHLLWKLSFLPRGFHEIGKRPQFKPRHPSPARPSPAQPGPAQPKPPQCTHPLVGKGRSRQVQRYVSCKSISSLLFHRQNLFGLASSKCPCQNLNFKSGGLTEIQCHGLVSLSKAFPLFLSVHLPKMPLFKSF